MIWEKNKYVREYFYAQGTTVWPDSTGMDGVIVYDEHKDGRFIPGKIINEAFWHAYRIRTGFIRGDVCYAFPEWLTDGIRRREFCGFLTHLLAIHPPLPCPPEFEWIHDPCNT